MATCVCVVRRKRPPLCGGVRRGARRLSDSVANGSVRSPCILRASVVSLCVALENGDTDVNQENTRSNTVLLAVRYLLVATALLHTTPQLTAATREQTSAQESGEVGRLRQAAARGDANAQFALGVRYASGKGVERDEAEGARWIRRAADQGHVTAQFNLGLMYADGNGVPQDSAQAIVWLRKAADQEDARAQSNLGLMYANGSGVAQDFAQAMQWYRKAKPRTRPLASRTDE